MKSLFNVTRSTYINSGHITDFFKEYFDFYAIYSINSHNTNKKDKSSLIIYKNGEVIEEKKYFTLPKNPPVYLVPIYQFLNTFNIISSVLFTAKKYHIKFDIFISSFCLWGLTGKFLQRLGFFRKTVFWSWDYFPLVKGDSYYLMLKLLQPFEKLAINSADYSWYASESNFDIRRKINQINDPSNEKHEIVHWGMHGKINVPTEPNISKNGTLSMLYFGSIDYEKGLDLIFDNLDLLNTLTNGKFSIRVIGGMTDYGIKLKEGISSTYKNNIFFDDFMTLEELKPYALNADLGLALYVPEINGEPNYTYYADPAKPRDYLCYGLPMLITKVPFIYKDIQEFNAGIVLDSYDANSLETALLEYMKEPEKYHKGAYELVQKDRYDLYYSKFFNKVYESLEAC